MTGRLSRRGATARAPTASRPTMSWSMRWGMGSLLDVDVEPRPVGRVPSLNARPDDPSIALVTRRRRDDDQRTAGNGHDSSARDATSTSTSARTCGSEPDARRAGRSHSAMRLISRAARPEAVGKGLMRLGRAELRARRCPIAVRSLDGRVSCADHPWSTEREDVRGARGRRCRHRLLAQLDAREACRVPGRPRRVLADGHGQRRLEPLPLEHRPAGHDARTCVRRSSPASSSA